MTDAFNFAEGIEIENLDGIHQCFEVNGENIIANISFENQKTILTELCNSLTAPLFFFIEIPCDENTEKKLQKSGSDCFHKDIYYLDNCTTKVILAILKRYGDLLLNDGLVQFGFASHNDEDEICVGKYKIISIYSKNITKYSMVLEDFKIPKEKRIKTVWDNFSDDCPGVATTIEFNGETINDVVENLKEVGLYYSQTREE